jgi:hypothetical protein
MIRISIRTSLFLIVLAVMPLLLIVALSSPKIMYQWE